MPSDCLVLPSDSDRRWTSSNVADRRWTSSRSRAVLEWVKRSERPVVTMTLLGQQMSPRAVARSRVRRERAVQELVDRGEFIPAGEGGWRLAR